MNAQEIRQAYLDFYKVRQHQIIERAPLILTDDATTLFTGSGMQPLMPYLLGKKHPLGVRLANSQTCFRSQDMDEVGDNRHTTFFEMLGNWSLGDYFKEQQIRWFFEFLTEVVGLDPSKLYVTCFAGDERYGIKRDDVSANIWQAVFNEVDVDAKIVTLGPSANGDKLGLQGGRIFFYDDGENWWSRGGGLETTPIGDPCGADSEVFYDFGQEFHDPSYGLPHPASDSGRFLEIGNQVFMEYRRIKGGAFEPLERKNVDFGGGLERIAAAKNQDPDIFKISLLWSTIQKLEALSGKKYSDQAASMRVITDHLRSAVFLALDGCVPSNKEHGYVMRRLIRRAIVKAFDLGIEKDLMSEILPIIIAQYDDFFPKLKQMQQLIREILEKEEKVFRQTLRKGLRELDKAVKNIQTKPNARIGELIFKMYDTYGFPVELSIETLDDKKVSLGDDWQVQFDRLMADQKRRSQTATKGKFKGGLVEKSSQKQTRLHTATHLMLAAMRTVLGDQVLQRGSNIDNQRIRFDFNYSEKVSAEKLKQIEDLVNQAIADKLDVSCEELPLDEAFKKGAHGVFNHSYGKTVDVYKIGNEYSVFSYEICGGPHVNNTAELAPNGEKFVIIKEQSSSAGVRRVKAVLK